MFPKRALFLPLLVSLCLADPRPKAADYPAHAESPQFDIGAEYLVHSVPNGRQTFFLPSFLVVDAAIYPKRPVKLSASNFTLVMNGTIPLQRIAPELVNTTVVSPFIGGVTPGKQPERPRADDPNRTAIQQADEESIDEATLRLQFPETEMHSAQNGFLYFAFNGKTKAIKTLDLVYRDGDTTVVVKLF